MGGWYGRKGWKDDMIGWYGREDGRAGRLVWKDDMVGWYGRIVWKDGMGGWYGGENCFGGWYERINSFKPYELNDWRRRLNLAEAADYIYAVCN